MIFHVLTIFPEFFRGPFEHGVIQRARETGALDIRIHNLRDWTFDRHKTVDDRPFGGGEGMLLKPDPLFLAAESIFPPGQPAGGSRRTVLLSAQGRLFDQKVAGEFTGLDELLLICGRYEGVDERVAEHLADDELSIGNYVLSGGELAAAVIIDAVARLLPGVLGNRSSAVFESFQQAGHGAGALDCPQYTRPAEFRGWKVPETLLSGNHEEIRRWRQRAALEKTARMRPDLLQSRIED
ncbi:MAG TPA: tRNA (guanosine(37)-N1)-methyltransferase TrmD [Bryobacteraceae bacterium]|nr:tRNA (guanosine(37)-N1)-methyltransferase TrmD [Bryobacteraceae bacterium]